MRWQKVIGAFVVSAHVLSSGCGPERTLVSQNLPPASELALGPVSTPVVARSQKSDREPNARFRSRNFLDALPENAPDLRRGEVAARIRATVNGIPILDEEVESVAYQFLVHLRRLPEPERSAREKEIRQKTLDQLIEREVLIQDATARFSKNAQFMDKLQEAANKEFDRQWMHTMMKSNNFKNPQDFKEFLHEQGLSLDMIRRQWVRNFMSMEYLRQLIMPATAKIGHEQMLEYYQQHPEDFEIQDSVQWMDIFISNARHGGAVQARQQAEAVLKRLQAGEDFVTLCKAHDNGDSVLRDGEGIGRKRGEIKPPEAESILFGLKDGQLGPLVELSHGYHIVKVVKREYAGQRPFDSDEVQKEISSKLKNETAERERKRVIAQLKRKAVIEYAQKP